MGSPADPSPTISFTQNGLAVGLNRANEPASASSACSPGGATTLSYGTWLADFNGDGLLDVYDVNHGQDCHLSGLWLNNGSGGFGSNLYSVGVKPAATNGVNLGLTNEMNFIGDFNGDGNVDMYLVAWGGLGSLCINQGNASHSDWTGPSFSCSWAWEPRTFGDVNGDGKIDIEVFDASAAPFDAYKDFCRTLPTTWKLNNGDPNPANWPSDPNYFHFVGQAAPGTLLDFNKDGLPDRLQGVEVASAQRGVFGTNSGGLRLSLGQANGTYLQVTSGLENVLEPAVVIEDVDEDGCLDVGTDASGYRDNQTWYVQNRSGATCLATFTPVNRTTMAYYPGFHRYPLDVDNDGLLDKAVIVHVGNGNNDGFAGGIHIFRKLLSGAYQDLGAAGTNINGTSSSEFYADQLSPGDWNNDGKMDIAGVGTSTIPGADNGIALWTSNLNTTNNWIKVRTPDVGGFFAGAATIEIFDAGFAGDPSHYVTPAKLVRTGQAWPSRVYHFGVGLRTAVDVKVTFPDGSQTTQASVATNSSIVMLRTPNLTPVASATANPTSAVIGQAVTFDGSGSFDPDGTISTYTWSFGDGATGNGAVVSHAYASPGNFTATLTVRDNASSTASAPVGVSVADVTAPMAPASLTATAVSATQINLAWTAATDDVAVTTYLIESCQGAGCSAFAQIGTATGISFSNTGLSPSTTYTFRVRAADGSGNTSDFSNTAAATTPDLDTQAPTAPATLTATTISTSQINLAWAASTDNVAVSAYLVERCQGSGCSSFAQVATTAATSFNNTGLTVGTSYSFRVRATDASGNLGGFSSTATASTISAPVTPAFVQRNFATPQTAQTAVAVPFTGAQTAGNLNVVIAGWGDATAHTVSVTDSRGNTYQLAVGPTTIGSGGNAASQSIYYAKNILAAGAGANTVTVSFSPAASFPDIRILEYSGIDPVNAVDVVAAGSGSSNASNSGTVTTTNASDLLVAGNDVATGTTGAGAGFTLRALTADGDIAEDRLVTTAGAQSATAPLTAAGNWVMQMVAFRAATPNADTQPPTAPAGLTATPVSMSQINLAWTASTDNVGVVSYAVERCLGAGCSSFAQVGTSTSAAFVDSGLAINTSYSYRVRASDAATNQSGYSNTATAVTLADTQPPTAPSNLTASAISASQINLGWTASTDNAGVTGYLIERCQGAGCSTFAQIATATVTSFSSTGLSSGTAYSFRVRATDAAGNLGAYSGTATATTVTVDTTAPTAPSSLTATTISTSQINLAWTAATDDVAVTSYLIERCQGAGCSTFAQIATAAGTTFNNTGLASGTSFSYRVRATDAAGNLGAYSNSATATTTAADTQAPTAPASLTATAISSSQVNLAWTASTDNVGVTAYLIERCQGAGCSTFAQIATAAGTTFNNTGLTASTAFSYRVRAQDAAGNLGAFSNTASATTPAAAANPTFVRGAFACPQTPQTIVTAAFTGAQAAGDLNVAIIGWSNSTTQVVSVTDGAGNAYTLAAGPTSVSGQATQSIYYARNIVAAATGNTVTVTFSASTQFPDLRILQYHGLNATAPLDVAASNQGTGNSASVSAVTTSATELIVAGNYVQNGTIGAGTGFTSRFITSPDSDIAEDRVVTTAGANTAAASLSGSGWWIMQMVTFKP